LAQNFVGRGEETAGHIEDALRLSPRDTAVYLWRTMSGSAKAFLAKDEETVGELRSAIEANRNFAAAHFYLAVALAEFGRLDEARLKRRRGSPSIPGSPSAATAPMRRAITRFFLAGGSKSTRSCEALASRRDSRTKQGRH
jgi:hypothetical protein